MPKLTASAKVVGHGVVSKAERSVSDVFQKMSSAALNFRLHVLFFPSMSLVDPVVRQLPDASQCILGTDQLFLVAFCLVVKQNHVGIFLRRGLPRRFVADHEGSKFVQHLLTRGRLFVRPIATSPESTRIVREWIGRQNVPQQQQIVCGRLLVGLANVVGKSKNL